VETLGKLRDTRAVAPLIEALGDGDMGVRQASAKALVAFDALGASTKRVAEGLLDYCLNRVTVERAKRVPFPLLAPMAEPVLTPLVALLGHATKERRKLAKKTLIAAGRLHPKLRDRMVDLGHQLGVAHRLQEVVDRFDDRAIPTKLESRSRVDLKWGW
jgi:hypothetical protein